MKNNWQIKKLGEIIKLEYGKPLDKSMRGTEGKYPVYGANGIKSYSSKFYYDKLSIIVGRKGSAGELNLTYEKFWPLDVTYFVTFDEKKYDLKFIYNLLCTLNLTRLAKGVKPGINRDDVYSIAVNMPESVIEQKRIVKILDGVFEEIENAKRNAEKNLQNSRELFESYLQNILNSPKNNWVKRHLEDVAYITMGQSPPGNTYNNIGIGLPLINGPVEFSFEQLSETHITKYTSKPTKKCRKGDLILCVRGSTTGRTNIAGCDACLGRGVASIRTKGEIKQKLLNIYLASLRKTFFSMGKGSTFPNISGTQISKINIHIPPILEQEKIIQKLDLLSGETKRLEEIYRKKLADLEELKKSVLKKAFAGEL